MAAELQAAGHRDVRPAGGLKIRRLEAFGPAVDPGRIVELPLAVQRFRQTAFIRIRLRGARVDRVVRKRVQPVYLEHARVVQPVQGGLGCLHGAPPVSPILRCPPQRTSTREKTARARGNIV
ncbi:hypothetical protein SDC9_206148 [bioreactor metagenome]|uniref:Uncharacterized protein n=1 Tax=bioreactor metagenome TaxID=1076179 RepID=A0A645JFS2_9ZZZZ